MIAGPTIFGITEFPNPEANKADPNQKVVAFHYFPLRYVLRICVTKMKQIVTKKSFTGIAVTLLQLYLPHQAPGTREALLIKVHSSEVLPFSSFSL